MTAIQRPVEPDLVACEMCMKEVPASEAQCAEAAEYVLHFCGLECFAKWKAQVEPQPAKKDT